MADEYDILKQKSLLFPPEAVFDLQRFASAEAEGRSEKATDRKKKKARDEGRVALSKDVPATVVTLLTFCMIYLMAKYIFRVMAETQMNLYENLLTIDLTTSSFYRDYLLLPVVKIFIPVASVAFVTAALSNYFQIGFKFTPKAIKMDLKKVNPNIFKFFKKQVFSMQGFFNLLKSLGKVGIIAMIAFFTIYSKREELLHLIHIPSLLSSFLIIVKIAFDLVLRVIVVLFIFSFVDYFFVRWQYEESLKMKKQEVKEEVKEEYGDPQVKSRLRQMYNALLSEKRMIQDVPNADVVVTNPTHFAVAMRYDSSMEEAPRVIAKGKDRFALDIRQTALDNDVFVYENPPLARQLFSDVEVNEIIPREMYGLIMNAYRLAYEYKDKVKAKFR